MNATVTKLQPKRRPPEAPAPALPTYAPAFPAELLRAMAALDAANSNAQRITRGNFTTTSKALELPGHLRAAITAAQAALVTLEGR